MRWIAVAWFVLASFTAFTQVGGKPKNLEVKENPRLRQALDGSKLKYTQLADGDFKICFNIDGARTQNVIIKGKIQEVDTVEIHDVLSIAWKGENAPTADIMNKLLIDNARKKIGAWELHSIKDQPFIIAFSIKISADIDEKALKIIVSCAAQEADKMEKELMDSDKF